MGKEFLHDLNIHGAGQIQFKNTAGTNAGKIDQNGNDLVLSNSVGDIIIGNGSDDVFIGDGTNTVDIRFEQNMAIFADSSSTRTLTLGGANTSLVLESPTISGSLSLGSTTINNNLIFTTANGHIVFDYEPSGDTGEYTTEAALLKIDVNGTEKTILSRVSEQGALALGADDTVAITAGDVKSIIKANHVFTNEQVLFAAESGFVAYGFPGNNTAWSNRNVFQFKSDSSTAGDNGLYIGDGGQTQFIDLSRNLKNIGTITASGKLTINTGSDDILTLNQTSTDTKWNYINFKNQGTREWFIGQDSDGNFDLYNDNIDAYAITVSLSNNSIVLNDNVNVAGNLVLNSNSNIVAARKFTARDANGVMLTADDATSGLSIADNGNATFTGSVTANQLNLDSIGDYITFYGGGETNHSITSRQLDGGTGDDIRVNTYGSFIVNLDSNNNQSTAANSSFFVGRHGSNASAISGTNLLFQIDGQTGDVLPGTDNTHDLGSSSYRWQNVVAVNLHGDLVGTINTNATAATQAAGNNTTKVATTAFVSTAVSNLVDSAPGTLNTLNELAAALGDDANFSTTVTNSISGKVSKSGDTMTGGLTTPGFTISTNDPLITFTDSSGSQYDWQTRYRNNVYEFVWGGGIKYYFTNNSILRFGDRDSGQLTNADIKDPFIKKAGNTTINSVAIGHLQLGTNNTTQLTIDAYGDATFAGEILVPSGDFISWGTSGYSAIEGSTVGNNLKLRTNNTIALTLDSSQNATFAGEVYSSGKLGIGTTDPNGDGYSFAEDLVIKGGNSASDGAGMTILANGKRYGVIAFGDSADPSIGEIFYDHDDNRMYFRGGGNNNTLYVDNSKINVSGNITVSGTVDGVDISGLPTFTTVGTNFAQLGNVSVASYIRINADETLSYLNAAQFLSAIGGLPKAGGTMTGDIILNDNIKAKFGTGSDFTIHHNGTVSAINNAVGHIQIYQNADDKNIEFYSDDASGDVTRYFFIDGQNKRVKAQEVFTLTDTSSLRIGSNEHGQLLRSSGNTLLKQVISGNIIIRQEVDDGDIKFDCDNGSGGVTEYFRIDGGAVETVFSKDLRIIDNEKLILGTSNDLELFHNGTNNVFNAYNGNLEITNFADDKDIKFLCDDGSGGTEVYINLDGSARATKFDRPTFYADSIAAKFGTDGDMLVYHSGSTGYIENHTGHFQLIQQVDDHDIIFKSDDGSGGTTEYFRLDGSSMYNIFSKDLYLPDNVMLRIGTGQDLRIFHGGTNSAITNTTGNLVIKNETDDGDIIFESDDGSGGIAEYFRVDGGVGYSVASKAFRFLDSVNVQLGDGADFTMQHNGTDALLQNFTGNLNIQNNTDDGDIIFKSDDGSGGTTEYFRVDGSSVQTIVTKNFRYVDNAKILIGTGEDLQIYHDASNSYINDTGTGSLILKGNSIKVNDDGDGNALFQVDASGDIGLKVETGSANYIFGDSAALGSGNFLEVQGGDSFDFKLFDSGTTTTKFQINPAGGFTRHKDNVIANFGDGNDLQIYHAAAGIGGTSIIDNATGDILIRNTADNRSISILTDNGSGSTTTYVKANGLSGAVELYHYGSKKFETTSSGISVTNGITLGGTIQARTIPYIIHTGWGDDTPSSGNIIVPLGNSTTDIAVSQADGFHFFVAPYAGKVQKIIMKNVAGSLSSSFTTELKLYINGTNVTSSGELTASSSAITWEPSSSNTFSAADEISLVYQKSTLSKYWREVSLTMVLTMNGQDI